MKLRILLLVTLLSLCIVEAKRSESGGGRSGRKRNRGNKGERRKGGKGRKNRNKANKTPSSTNPSSTGGVKPSASGSRAIWQGPAPPAGSYPKSCHDIFESYAKRCEHPKGGQYAIQPTSSLRPKYVECIFDDERGWTVIQNRYSGEVCFNRGWNDYRMGFGCPIGVGKLPDWYSDSQRSNATENAEVDVPSENTSMCPLPYSSPYHDDQGRYDPDTYPNNYRGPRPRRTDMLPECNGESWAGLDYMFWIQRSHGPGGTKLCNYIAADRLTYQYVCYDNFRIAGWKEQYAIKAIDDFDIDLTDITDQFNGSQDDLPKQFNLVGAKFSTFDRDNDNSTRHCAKDSNSGWWFNDCSGVNLNGVFHGARLEKDKFDVKTGARIHPRPLDGVFWNSPSNKWSSLRMTKMFVAPREPKEYPCMYDP